MLHKDRPNTQIENTYDGAYSGSTDDNARQPASNSFEAVIQVDTYFFRKHQRAFVFLCKPAVFVSIIRLI